jgi:histidinol-phosphate/aromatic aminotransferase/cobyric acid decarboxylase-like protein
LREIGFAPLPSAANFLFVPTASARLLAGGLRKRGVLVRAFTGLPTALAPLAAAEGAALRIGIGPWEMMQAVLDALTEAAACE